MGRVWGETALPCPREKDRSTPPLHPPPVQPTPPGHAHVPTHSPHTPTHPLLPLFFIAISTQLFSLFCW